MNFICADTEDDSKELLEAGKSGFDKQVTQVAARSASGTSFYCAGAKGVPQFKRWFKQRKEKYCYFHNLQYDLGNLFGKELDKLDCVMVGGRMIRATWGNKIFVDSFNVWPMSVKKIGVAFGLEKLETDSMSTDREYVFRDVEIIRQAMLFAWRFCQANGIENLPSTLGGLCVKLWKAWGGENCHDSLELSRSALYGGRVELFKVKNESSKIAWTDINSLYPFVMLGKFPDQLQEWKRKTLPPYGVATVTVKVKAGIEFPVLPFRHDDGRILYPTGHFTGTWTVPEIREAERSGYVIEKIHAAAGSKSFLRPYGTFVEKLYRDRLASNSEAEKLFFKLLMNNLYGRLGTTGVIGRSVFQTDQNKFDGVPYGEKVLVSYAMPLSDETNWSHAAYVTAYGRLELLKYMRLVGRDKLIYTDTDSTIFDCPSGKLPFPTGTALGEMKLEGWETNCRTYAPKMYRVGKKYKAKGVPQRLAKQYIEQGKAQFDLPFKFREAIRFYDERRDKKGRLIMPANSRRLSVWRGVEKVNRVNYDRKKLKGNRFSPCKINHTWYF